MLRSKEQSKGRTDVPEAVTLEVTAAHSVSCVGSCSQFQKICDIGDATRNGRCPRFQLALHIYRGLRAQQLSTYIAVRYFLVDL
jgi:hypothetical protein